MTSSVIIALYNKADSILNCLNSLVCQISLPTEVIIVDDQSTDGSFEKVESYISSVESEIKFYMHRNYSNSGPSIARNLGLNFAQGDLIFFLDADDFYTSSHILSVSNFFKSNNTVGIVVTGTMEYELQLNRPDFNNLFKKKLININEDGIYTTDDFVKVFCEDPIFCGCGNVVILNKIISSVRFDPNEKNFEDWFFFYQICQKVQSEKVYRIAFMPENIGVIYNSNDINSLSRKLILNDIYHVPRFVDYNFVDYRFRRYVLYNWLFSNMKRTVSFKSRWQLFIFFRRYFLKFQPPIFKFFIPSILLLFKLDLIVISLAKVRKKLLYD